MARQNLNPAPLRAQGVGPGITDTLQQRRLAVGEALTRTVSEDVSAYRQSGNPDILPELAEHIEGIVGHVIRLLSGSHPVDFTFVRAHAERRAAQRFPLEAVLHTYRCAHKVLFEWIRDAAVENAVESAHIRRVVAAAAELTIEYTDTISTTATSAYVDYTRKLAEAEGDRRAELLNVLLQGYDEADARAAKLLRRSGYLEQRQSYCVIAARSVRPEEMQSPARAQRMADAIGEVLARSAMRTLIGIRDDHVIAIVSGVRRQSGWTAPQSIIGDRLLPLLRIIGPAALIGMSNDVPSTSHIPRAAGEARWALEFASVGERIRQYSDISLRQRLVALARDDIQAAMPGWLAGFREADAKSKGRLTETLRAYADADMNVQQAAKRLSVHPNTIYARAQRIQDLTGKNLLAYHDLTELLLAADCTTA